MTTAKQAQVRLRQEYGATLDALAKSNPVAAAVVREYVSALRYEAAGYRRENHRAQCELAMLRKSAHG